MPVIRERDPDLVYTRAERENHWTAFFVAMLLIFALGALAVFMLSQNNQRQEMMNQLDTLRLQQSQSSSTPPATQPVPYPVTVPQPVPVTVPQTVTVPQPYPVAVPSPTPAPKAETPAPAPKAETPKAETPAPAPSATELETESGTSSDTSTTP